MKRTARGRMIERLAYFPGKATLVGFPLPVTACQVDPDGVAEDVHLCVSDGNVSATARYRDDKLHFILKVVGHRRVRNDCTVENYGIRRLLKEKRRISFVCLVHFTDMVDIVTPYTINPSHCKGHIAANHRNECWGRCCDRTHYRA